MLHAKPYRYFGEQGAKQGISTVSRTCSSRPSSPGRVPTARGSTAGQYRKRIAAPQPPGPRRNQ